jgi:magnesium transporter
MAARDDVVNAATPSPVVPVAEIITPRDALLPRSFYIEPGAAAGAAVRRDLSVRELAEVVQRGHEGGGQLWVDVDTTCRQHMAVLDKVFAFHPLAIEDTLSPSSRVKLEEFPEYLFAIIRGVRFHDRTDDPYDLETFNMNFFLGRNFLVTAHGERADAVMTIMSRLERSPDIMSRGVERLMHLVMDASVDAYFPIVDQIDEFVAGLEERVFVKFDESALRDIFSVKRLVLELRRHLTPQREVFNVLTNRPSALLRSETQLYFRDIYDHILRIHDSLETYRDLLSSTLESYLSQVSNRLGQISKTLSVVATLSIPFVVVSGMWGMNFDELPLQHTWHGFWLMVVLQLAIGALLVLVLRRRRLL